MSVRRDPFPQPLVSISVHDQGVSTDSAIEHAGHDREGVDTRYVEACWRCAENWRTYIAAHPDEMPAFPIVLAIGPTEAASERAGIPLRVLLVVAAGEA